MMADWQRGFELSYLQSFGDLFKRRHKALVFGAFGLTKERDVAEALERKRIIWAGTPPVAAAIFNVSKADATHQDFAQRDCLIPEGSIVIKAFACDDSAAGARILTRLCERAPGRRIWVEAFEEDRAACAALAECGFAYVCTKISAGSEIKGLYCRGMAPPLPPLPAEEAATQCLLRAEWLTAEAHAAILDELSRSGDRFAQHYSDYNKRKSWTAFALRGYQDNADFIIKPAEMAKGWKDDHPELMAARVRWTEAAPLFQVTIAQVERLGLQLDRVRFMRLRSKNGELSRHADITDREAGLRDGCIARLHVPIRTSQAVTFVGYTARGERLEQKFAERSLFYLDQRKPHAVYNTDPALDRIHLVIDCFADAYVRQMIAEAQDARAAPDTAALLRA